MRGFVRVGILSFALVILRGKLLMLGGVVRIRGTFAVVFVVSLVLIAGCGGDQSNQSNKKQSENGNSQKATPAQKKKERKIALGTISNVKVESKRLFLHPTKGDRELIFRIGKKPNITLNGRRARLAQLKKGQQANIEYFTNKKSVNIARAVEVFGGLGGKKPGGGGERTSEGGEKTDEGGETTGG